MKLPIRVNCRPAIGIDNWEVTVYDSQTNEVFSRCMIHTDDIRREVDIIMNEVAKAIEATIEIL